MRFLENKSNKFVAPRIWSYDQKITLYSLPVRIEKDLHLGKNYEVCKTCGINLPEKNGKKMFPDFKDRLHYRRYPLDH